MKKKTIQIVVIVFFVLLFAVSCLSEPIRESVFDPSIPESNSSKILFWLDITTYNGIDIHESWAPGNDIPLVTIPAGNTVIGFTAYFSRDYGNLVEYYTINDCEFKFNFEGGKEYTVRWFLEKKPKKFLSPQEYLYYIRIYGKLPKNLKGYKNNSDLTGNDLLASILLFDTEQFKK